MTFSVAFDTLDIPAPGGSADAYLTHPDDGSAHPGLLFFMDAFGLRPWIREMMETISAQGFTVLAPNIFYRTGRAPVRPMPDFDEPNADAKFFAALAPVRQSLTPDRSLHDAGAYLDWLDASDYVTPGALGVVGYCMGGRLALRTAGEYGPRIAAAASFHGGRLAVEEAPDSPHHAADRMTAELYIAHASADPSMPADQIALLDKALDAAGVRHTSVTYPDAGHGFTMRDTPAYDAEAYQRHLRDLVDLLHRAIPGDRAPAGGAR
ncbi:dienelactone hydrolase family protein [Nocardia sp. NPDC050710]|uniref:dienelactone hydrolase family protein n=1 Tax=Nocardia sp. NPDC050710 TaxID=3157220 RepID=UPI0033FC4143